MVSPITTFWFILPPTLLLGAGLLYTVCHKSFRKPGFSLMDLLGFIILVYFFCESANATLGYLSAFHKYAEISVFDPQPTITFKNASMWRDLNNETVIEGTETQGPDAGERITVMFPNHISYSVTNSPSPDKTSLSKE